VKIVKYGNIYQVARVRRFTCCRCGSVFDADNGEYTTVVGQIEYMYDNIIAKCICPVCGSTSYSYDR